MLILGIIGIEKHKGNNRQNIGLASNPSPHENVIIRHGPPIRACEHIGTAFIRTGSLYTCTTPRRMTWLLSLVPRLLPIWHGEEPGYKANGY